MKLLYSTTSWRLLRVILRRYKSSVAMLGVTVLAFGLLLVFVLNFTGWTVGQMTFGSPPTKQDMARDFINTYYWQLDPTDRDQLRKQYGLSENETSPTFGSWKIWRVTP
jgi:hypothetical protein